MKKFVFAACAAVLVCGLSIGGYAYYKTPVAYLSLDINPSVELGVNTFNQVVSVTGYNADGKTILAGKNVVNSNIKDAVEELVASASKNGFINSDGSTIVSVTAETDNAAAASALEKNAQQGADDAIKSSGDTAVVYKDNVALSRRDEARKLGITPGKLNLIQKLQALDPTITVDQYKDAKVTDIMKKIIALRSLNSTDNSDSETQDIESAVKQSNKNADNTHSHKNENNSSSSTVTNSSSTKNNDNNKQNDYNSSAVTSSTKGNGNSDAQNNRNNNRNSASTASSTKGTGKSQEHGSNQGKQAN